MTSIKRELLSHEMEDYLKAIYKLQSETGSVSSSSLAKKLSRSPAAITKMMKSLSESRLIDYAPYYGVRLTPSGERIALEVIRHHRLLELYLHQALGYSWDEVDAEAEKLEHHISEEFEARIDKLLDYPLRDPHGDPIPSRDGFIPPLNDTPLSSIDAGETVVICRVKDSDPEVLRHFARIGMTLGATIEVISKQPVDGQLLLSVLGEHHSLGRELAGSVFVESGPVSDGTV